MNISDLDLEAFLKKNDAKFWLKNCKLASARNFTCAELAGTISGSRFRQAVDKHCLLFKKLPRRKPSKITRLSVKQWEHVNDFSELHLSDLQGKDIDFVVAFLRAFGVPANRSIVRGSMILRPVVSDPSRQSEERLPSWLV